MTELNMKIKVQSLIESDYDLLRTPRCFSELEKLWWVKYGKIIDPAELYAALETLELEGALICAAMPDDGKICHLPAAAEPWLREVKAQYWTGQRAKVQL